MSTSEILDSLKHLTNAERLAVIETASRLIRADLTGPEQVRAEEDRRLRAAAAAAKDLYEPGSEHVAWTDLDAEEFEDEPAAG